MVIINAFTTLNKEGILSIVVMDLMSVSILLQLNLVSLKNQLINILRVEITEPHVKYIVLTFVYLFIWGFISLSTLYRSYITMGRFVGRGNQYIQFIKLQHCKLPTISKQLPTFPHKVRDLNRQPQRWEVSVLTPRHCGQSLLLQCKQVGFGLQLLMMMQNISFFFITSATQS